ncbi:MAG: hypothetical protein A4E43_01578 [Methanosaeta sp. PtaB.Bin005]|nr:MAG: hypothetical protein A4E43_01578 [Methanosaeta sp. PtaB.Bin005]
MPTEARKPATSNMGRSLMLSPMAANSIWSRFKCWAILVRPVPLFTLRSLMCTAKAVSTISTGRPSSSARLASAPRSKFLSRMTSVKRYLCREESYFFRMNSSDSLKKASSQTC